MQTCCFICHQICMGSTETGSFFGCPSALAKRTSKHLRRLFHALFVQLLETTCVFTGRNEVVAKVIFLHLSVILFTGGGSASMHAGIPPPHRADTPPRSRHPPPRSRHPPGADTPLPPPRSWPPREQTPPGKQTPAYGLRAVGTHPTGMHSCFPNGTWILSTCLFHTKMVNILRVNWREAFKNHP